METELISVIVPTFQRAALVCGALRTAFAQTYPRFEVVVVDDGSTDGTGEKIRAEFGDRVRYHWQPNQGVASARNRAVTLSAGALLAFLDSDDAWMPEKLERQARYLVAHPTLDMVLTDLWMQDRLDPHPVLVRRREAIPKDGNALLEVWPSPYMIPSTVMVRRAAFVKVGGFDETLRVAEDVDFFLRFAHALEIGVVDEPLACYSQEADSLSVAFSTMDAFAAVLERFASARSRDLPDKTIARAMFTAYTNKSAVFWRTEAWPSARSALERALPWARSPGESTHIRELMARIASR
jgi:glycosyltransferase involved in cell wall biosynthesis